jgi:hypothetical protein
LGRKEGRWMRRAAARNVAHRAEATTRSSR